MVKALKDHQSLMIGSALSENKVHRKRRPRKVKKPPASRNGENFRRLRTAEGATTDAMAVRPETYSIPAYCRLNRSQGQGQAPPRADTALSPGVPEEVPVSVLVI